MTKIIVQNQIVALENQAERIQIECMNTIRKKKSTIIITHQKMN